MKSTHCENCGELLVRPYRRWCGKPECRVAAERTGKRQSREYFKSIGSTRRKPESIKPKGHPNRRCIYPPNANPERQCGKPLKNTANYFYCQKHLTQINKWQGTE